MKQRTALVLCTALLSLLALFQLALILGVPWGSAAWGGQQDVLPTRYRIASAGSIVIYGLMLWVARRRVTKPENRGFRVAAWIVFAYFCLGVLLNGISKSSVERIWVPVTIVLAWAFFSIARTSKPQTP